MSQDFNITFTTEAIEQILKVLKKNPSNNAIHLSLKTTGCSGLSWVIKEVNTRDFNETDFEYSQEVQGVNFLFDKSLNLAYGTTIDYSKEGLNSKFSFLNPREKGKCGCGASFRV